MPALVVGIDDAVLRSWCRELRDLGRIRSPHGLDNDEDGAPLRSCVPVHPWSELRPSFRHLG